MAGSSGFRGTSTLLMVVAVAAMAGFLWWVYQEAQSVESSLTATPDSAEVEETAVTPTTLAEDPSSAIGRNAVFDSVEVEASLGRGVFTVALNDSVALPVLLNPQMLQQGATVYGGDRVTVGGRFYTLNDSIRDAWVGRGAVDSARAGDLPSTAAFLLLDSLDIQS